MTEETPAKIWHLYKITNLINGKIYIGYTKQTLKKRFKQHCQPSSQCVLLCKAIQKYGRQNFIIEDIGSARNEAGALDAEIQLIAQYQSYNDNIGYNLTLGGKGSPLTSKQKTERKKIFARRQETLDNEPQEQKDARKLRLGNAIRAGYARMTPEERKEQKEKQSVARKEAWDKRKTEMTPEEIEQESAKKSEENRRRYQARKDTMTPEAFTECEVQWKETMRIAKAKHKAEKTPADIKQSSIKRSDANPRTVHLTEQDKIDMRAAYALGTSIDQIRKKYGITWMKAKQIVVNDVGNHQEIERLYEKHRTARSVILSEIWQSEDLLNIQSENSKELWQTEEYRTKVVAALQTAAAERKEKGTRCSEETKTKISEAHKTPLTEKDKDDIRLLRKTKTSKRKMTSKKTIMKIYHIDGTRLNRILAGEE